MSKSFEKTEDSEDTVDIGRRSALSRLGLAASAAYAIPVLITLSQTAHAGGGSDGGSSGGDNDSDDGGSGGNNDSDGGSAGASNDSDHDDNDDSNDRDSDDDTELLLINPQS